MDNPVHEEVYRGYGIAIHYDFDPQNPRKGYYDNLGKMACWHSRYDLGDEHNFSEPEDFVKSLLTDEENERIERWHEREYGRRRLFYLEGDVYFKAVTLLDAEASLREWTIAHSRNLILPLYLYDHGGITISHGSFSCPWDSGQVGWHYVSYADIRKEYSTRAVTKGVLERVRKVLDCELEVYDHYLTGEVYGYICTDPDGEEFEDNSCWGYYEDYDEYPLRGARECIDSEIAHREKERQKRVKTMIRHRVPLEKRA